VKLGVLLHIALRALATNKLRSALTMLGIVIGVGAVIVMVAVGAGAQARVEEQIRSLGSNLLLVLSGARTQGGVRLPQGSSQSLSEDDAIAISQEIPEALAAPALRGGAQVIAGNANWSTQIYGTTPEYLQVREWALAAGRGFTAAEMSGAGKVCLLGATVARELFGSSSPLGEVVRIGDWRYRVVGVLAPHGHSLGFDFDDVVLIPVGTAMRMFNRTSLFRILIEMESAEQLEEGERAILELMRDRHRADDVTVITQDAVVSTFSSILGVLTLALVAIASISLTVAGIGIMNVMLVAVAERRREIGLLKAVGAGTGQILAVFLTEAAVLAAVGGIVGLLGGSLAVQAFVRVYPSFPATTPAWAVAAALAVAVGVGVVFGTLPARRAARLDPVRALQGR